MSCSRTEPYRWALSENIYDEDFRADTDPRQMEDIMRAQELERFGYALNLHDLDPDNPFTVIIPRFKDLAFSARDIKRILGRRKLRFGNRDQIAFLTGYEYLCLAQEFGA